MNGDTVGRDEVLMAARRQGLMTTRPEPAPGSGASERTLDVAGPLERPSIELMGARVDHVDGSGAIDRIMGSLDNGVGGWVITPNVDILRRIVSDPAFGRLAAQADLSIADGMPLVWASRLQGTPLPARVAASELVFPLTQRASRRGYSLFLLGGDSGTAKQTASVLLEHAPGVSIAGTYAPPVGFERDDAETRRIVTILCDATPDIVLCAFGCPKQERLMVELRRWLPRAWFIGVGGSFTIASGRTPAAPPWMRRWGLEWVHRLRLEPQRLSRRYLVDDLPFALRLLLTSALAGIQRRRVGRGA
jgi:N-acetylglucosaminyldiphosphoundecaprenol N-acetyl-beta-D-mannosaminyltransferase